MRSQPVKSGVGGHLDRERLLPVQVTIGSEDLKANHMIQQIFEFPQEFEKYALLVWRHTLYEVTSSVRFINWTLHMPAALLKLINWTLHMPAALLKLLCLQQCEILLVPCALSREYS